MRLGCEVTAVDLNPVAWFILKCTLDYPRKLAGETRPLPEFALRDRDLMAAFLKAQGVKGRALRRELAALGVGDDGDTPEPKLLDAKPAPEADLAWQVRAWGRRVLAAARRRLARRYPTYAAFQALKPGGRPFEPRPLTLLAPDADGNADAGPLNAAFDAVYLKDARNPRWVAKPTVAYLWARTVRCKGCRATIPLLKTRWLAKKGAKRVLLTMTPAAERHRRRVRGRGRRAAGRRQSRAAARARPADGRRHDESLRRAVPPLPGHHDDAGSASRRPRRATGRRPDRGRRRRTARQGVPPSDGAGAAGGARGAGGPRHALRGRPVRSCPTSRRRKRENLGASRAFSVDGYGFDAWRTLFTNRQLLALGTFVQETRRPGRDDGRLAGSVARGGGRDADADDQPPRRPRQLAGDLDQHDPEQDPQYVRPLRTADGVGLRGGVSAGGYERRLRPGGRVDGGSVRTPARRHARRAPAGRAASVRSRGAGAADADAGFDLICTDPPYYDAIPYSDLMDFFHVWLRRALWGLSPAIDAAFETPLGPKWNAAANDGELIDDAARFDGDRAASKRNYEDGMARAFSRFHAALRDDGRLVIVFANKSPDAWETLVSALIRAGFVVDGSWPIQTERLARTRAMQSAALASSIWIVCRKRPAARAGWDTAVLTEMRENISQQLRDFWDAGIRGPDFVWAATGPALEAFSKYPAVKQADDADSQMTVSEFLRAVRRFVVDFVVGRVLTRDGDDEATSGLDDVTTYYLLHRNDFGLGDAPIGACILYAISCNLSDRDLTDRYDVLSRGARASDGEPDDDEPDADEDARRAGRSRRREPGQAEAVEPAHRQVARLPDAGRPSPAADRPGAPADALLARRRRSEGQRLSRRARPEAPRPLRATAAGAHRAGRRRIRRTRDPGIALEPHRGAGRRRARAAAEHPVGVKSTGNMELSKWHGSTIMDVKESARTAKRYIADVFSDENISDVRLEEVEMDDPPGVWRITVSFLRPAEDPEQSGGTASAVQVAAQAAALGFGDVLRPLRRAYKIVEIDDDSGQLRAVRHRMLKAVD